MKYAAIDINWDSLGEAYGFPTDYHDPTFFEVADRFMAVADRYGFRYSIYIIGKDLEKAENRAAVQAWAAAGHEIGNHTWTHPRNLAGLPAEQIREQIARTHNTLIEITGQAPQGFIAPSWNASGQVRGILNELGYTYDTSLFPSWLYYAVLARLVVNYMGDKRLFTLLNRRDYHRFFTASRQAQYAENKLVVLPVPTTRYRLACWHTLAFVVGWERYAGILKNALDQTHTFYYLMHPADLIAADDLDPHRSIRLERMNVPLEQKLELFEKSIQIIVESGRKIITMREMAEKFRAGEIG